MLSAFIYENGEIQLTEPAIRELRPNLMNPPAVPARAEKLLFYLSKRYPAIGQKFEFNQRAVADPVAYFKGFADRQKKLACQYLALYPVTVSQEWYEVVFLHDLLVKEGFIEGTEEQADIVFRITADGWEHLASIQKNPTSAYGFVAMRFISAMDPFYVSGVMPAIRSAGYHPLRIDRHEHVNRIDDEIIAKIKQARFCVADLTHQNQGVYFEAGYALGFGIPVIWTCLEGETVHFDTRQFNRIMWRFENLEEFIKALSFRIQSIIGIGPIAPSQPQPKVLL